MNVDEIQGERQLVGRENVSHFMKRKQRPIMNLRIVCEDKGANHIGYFSIEVATPFILPGGQQVRHRTIVASVLESDAMFAFTYSSFKYQQLISNIDRILIQATLLI